MILKNQQVNKSVIGVFLSGKILNIGKVKNGKVEKSLFKKINNKESEENILKVLIDTIAEVIDDEVVGIGVGVPSLVDVKNGVVYRVQNIPSWREVHLKEILEARFGVSIYVNNDANCFAVGEKYYGKAINYDNIVGLILGVGMGTGVIFNGHLYSGTNCGAGEFGYIQFRDHDYEYYCSEAYFEEKYGLSYDTLLERAKNADKVALAIFEQFGYSVGSAIKTIMFSVDPQLVVIGGGLSSSFKFFQKAMWEIIKTFPYKHSLAKLSIECSEKEDIAILGAAALYFDANNQILIK